MRVEGAALREVGVELDAPARGGRRTWRARRGVRLHLHARGHSGVGEAAPLPGYSPDSLVDARRALQVFCASPTTCDLDRPLADAMVECLAPIPRAIPSARFAVETALLDLIARMSHSSVHALLGGPGHGAHDVAALVSGASPEHTISAAHDSVAAGAGALKLKLAHEHDWATLESLRDGLPDVPVRLDLNQSLGAREVAACLARAADQRVELLEEPSPSWRDWPTAAGCPLFVDESLRDEAVRRALPDAVASGHIAGAVLKPALLGGAFECLDLAGRVRAAGGEVFVTHLFDGGVGLAAAAELALALGGARAHGLGPHPGLALGGDFQAFAIRGFALVPHDSAGLGHEAAP